MKILFFLSFVGSGFTTETDSSTAPLAICNACNDDSDCGTETFGMRCDQTRLQCVCDDYRLDSDGDATNGCEVTVPVGSGLNLKTFCAKGDIGSCPNAECWSYNPYENQCQVKKECAELTCGTTEIVIKFTENIFGDETDTATIGTLLGSDVETTDTGFSVTCELGTCGMSYEIVDTNIEFSMTMRNSAEEIAGKIDELDFTCRYARTLDVSSKEFEVDDDVDDGAVDGVVDGIGSLQDGFELTITDAEGVPDKVRYGQTVLVTTEWKLKGLTDVQFNYKSCEVSQGENHQTFIIQDWCYAGLFGANPHAATHDEITMSYLAFSFNDLEKLNQKMICSIEVCIDECPRQTDSMVCPNGDLDQFHQYKFKLQTSVDPDTPAEN